MTGCSRRRVTASGGAEILKAVFAGEPDRRSMLAGLHHVLDQHQDGALDQSNERGVERDCQRRRHRADVHVVRIDQPQCIAEMRHRADEAHGRYHPGQVAHHGVALLDLAFEQSE